MARIKFNIGEHCQAPRLTSEESHELARRVHAMGAHNLLELLRQLPTSEESSSHE